MNKGETGSDDGQYTRSHDKTKTQSKKSPPFKGYTHTETLTVDRADLMKEEEEYSIGDSQERDKDMTIITSGRTSLVTSDNQTKHFKWVGKSPPPPLVTESSLSQMPEVLKIRSNDSQTVLLHFFFFFFLTNLIAYKAFTEKKIGEDIKEDISETAFKKIITPKDVLIQLVCSKQ
ncbi:hypothetical protein RFI_21196 [Reticulomyxa filosa]|uniref:Uncharacterized protein n=1 Tax=Reticulomyxa filosa TaxID=46433 RepID=X6MSS4_RETFI|nr:hypothetical protein RFI_21196 [Reticulomyxa filosa]|eukprot:ETO16165.1 hypothetical protein RFI_21196 [Reticulomyxa filosa]